MPIRQGSPGPGTRVSRPVSVSFVTLILLLAWTALPLEGAPLPGAIFTTNSSCSGVDLNIYGSKDEVYLNGGPAHPGAAGLPDGSYWVQVTSPEGTLLGSSTTAVVTVSGGEFVQCYQLSAILVKASDGTPGYDDTPNAGGEYKVWVSTVSTFDNNSTKTDNFKVKTSGPCPDPNDPSCGGHVPQAELKAIKFYDADGDGQEGAGEVELVWPVCVQEAGAINDCNHTTPLDMFVDPGSYTVTEGTPVQANWVHTTPSTDTFTVSDGDVHTSRFGNVCLGAGGGLTLGFWSNKNGQALISSSDLAGLTALHLVKADGSAFDPASAAQVRSWLLSATATNMAYMLSAQLAAMYLNVAEGKVSASAVVYSGGCVTGTGKAPGFITIAELMSLADASLAAHPVTLSGDAERAYQECLKTTLDKANNSLNFVQATPCPYSF